MLRALSECSLDADRRLPPVSPSPQRGSVAARPTSAASSKASKASTATGVGLQRQQKQTRDEARRIQVRQMSGAAVGMALKPSRGLRDDIRFAGGEPKDHRSENYRKLRDLQRERQALEQERAKPPPVPFKMKQFENVKARLSTHRPHTASDTGSETASNYNHSSRPSTADSSHRGAPSIASYASTSSSKNYIHLNAIKAKEPKNKGVT
ncbi:hypothetical protein BC830DRAFT_948045 [Chytriomyces sp. MP71]|nr:hypothetical protein BC830DRAFT_948045 [Chytriomyces sp. MP71]